MLCPTEEQLLRLTTFALTADERAEVHSHVDRCESCRVVLAACVETSPEGVPGAPLRPGDVVGRYEILSCIGAGATSVVYEAHDPAIARRVAIKILHERAEMGADEAKAIARVRHPNVLSVFDMGVHLGAPYFVFELVDGTTLNEWLRAKPRALAEIRFVMQQVALGLAAAHAAGVVHHDIKPANILVEKTGHVRVGDFGASACSRAGTPAYSAPEVRRGDRGDERSDQYSFCVLLDEAFGARAPAKITRLVRRGLSQAPADRHDSMATLAQALSPSPHRVTLSAVLCALVVLFLPTAPLGIAGWDRPTRAAIEAARGAFLVSRIDHLAQELARTHDTTECVQARTRELAALIALSRATALTTDELLVTTSKAWPSRVCRNPSLLLLPARASAEAQVLIWAGHGEEAEALIVHDTSDEARLLRAQAAIDQRHFDVAFDRLAGSFETAEARFVAQLTRALALAFMRRTEADADMLALAYTRELSRGLTLGPLDHALLRKLDGAVFTHRRDFDRGRAETLVVLEMTRAALGAGSYEALSLEHVLSFLAYRQDDLSAMRLHARRALDEAEVGLGAEHPRLPQLHMVLAMVDGFLGHHEEAIAALDRALLTAAPNEVPAALVSKAWIAIEQGNHAQALAWLDAARAFPGDDEDAAEIDLEEVSVHLSLGDPERALRALERVRGETGGHLQSQRAVVLAMLGRDAEAQRAMRAEPLDDQTSRARAALVAALRASRRGDDREARRQRALAQSAYTRAHDVHGFERALAN